MQNDTGINKKIFKISNRTLE